MRNHQYNAGSLLDAAARLVPIFAGVGAIQGPETFLQVLPASCVLEQQCFSNSRAYRNPLEDLWKHRLLALPLEFLI